MPAKSLSEQARSLLRFYEDDFKPHQKIAQDAYKASAAADAMSDQHKYGQIGMEKTGSVRDAHKKAHDAHMAAAQAMQKAGQYGVSQQHHSLATKHAQLAAHYHQVHGHHSGLAAMRSAAAKKKASGESVEGRTDYMNEQRRLMGYNPYPTLKESVTLRELEEFDSEIQSWRYRQRDLMGLEPHYFSLKEVYDPPSEEDSPGKLVTKDPSQGLADVNYQTIADKAERASNVANRGLPGAHRAAAQAHMAAAKLATNAQKRREHEAVAAHHEYHAFRSPETKTAQVRDKTARGAADMSPGSTSSMPATSAGGPVVGVPGTVKETVLAKFAPFFRKMLGEAADNRDIPASVKHQARSIEKDGGPFKKRKGGAKTRAGIAYAIAWKNHCKKNPGSRHCHKGEGVDEATPPPIALSKARHKTLSMLNKKKSTSDAGLDTLAKLRKKHGMEAVEDAASDATLAKLAKKHGPEGPDAKKKASMAVLNKLRAKHGKEHIEAKGPGMSVVDKMKGKKMKREATEDDGLLDAVDAALQERAKKEAMGTNAMHPPPRPGAHVPKIKAHSVHISPLTGLHSAPHKPATKTMPAPRAEAGY